MSDYASLLIFGAGGHGRVVASTARAAGWSAIVFFDPRWPALKESGGWPVEGKGAAPGVSTAGRHAIAAIGNNHARLSLLDALAMQELLLATVIHPTAWLCPSVVIGQGSVVFAQAAVNHGSRLERGVIVNTGAVVEHDCLVGAGAHISPRAVLAGGVSVGESAWVGVGASVRQGIRIGDNAVIGAGAAVVTDVPDSEIWVGVPARRLRRITPTQ